MDGIIQPGNLPKYSLGEKGIYVYILEAYTIKQKMKEKDNKKYARIARTLLETKL